MWLRPEGLAAAQPSQASSEPETSFPPMISLPLTTGWGEDPSLTLEEGMGPPQELSINLMEAPEVVD